MFSFRPDGATPIILPAAEILKVAKQAPEAKEKESENKTGSKEPKQKESEDKKTN